MEQCGSQHRQTSVESIKQWARIISRLFVPIQNLLYCYGFLITYNFKSISLQDWQPTVYLLLSLSHSKHIIPKENHFVVKENNFK